jgi:hypothetical protein
MQTFEGGREWCRVIAFVCFTAALQPGGIEMRNALKKQDGALPILLFSLELALGLLCGLV